jgi:hypothetical protein
MILRAFGMIYRNTKRFYKNDKTISILENQTKNKMILKTLRTVSDFDIFQNHPRFERNDFILSENDFNRASDSKRKLSTLPLVLWKSFFDLENDLTNLEMVFKQMKMFSKKDWESMKAGIKMILLVPKRFLQTLVPLQKESKGPSCNGFRYRKMIWEE